MIIFLLFYTFNYYKTDIFTVTNNIQIFKSTNLLYEIETAHNKMHILNESNIHHNIKTKETWYITETEETTNGKYFEMYEHIDKNGFVNVEHIHPYQSEFILVLEGEINLKINRKSYILKKGYHISIPSNILHEIDNRNYNQETLLLVQYTPALNNIKYLFEQLAKMSQDGKLDEDGFPSINIFGFKVPNLCVISNIFLKIPGMYKLWWLPDIFQDIIFRFFDFLNNVVSPYWYPV
jgi:quercetin dioxygenase-like cupin family protein